MTVQFSEVIALDVGKKRTGLARVNLIAKIPEPLQTIETKNVLKLLPDVIKEHGAQALVIGLPRGMQAQETEQTEWVKEWTAELAKHIKLPFYWQDETATSLEAENMAKTSSNTPAASIDSLSACILLQDFLMTPEHLRWKIEGQS